MSKKIEIYGKKLDDVTSVMMTDWQYFGQIWWELYQTEEQPMIKNLHIKIVLSDLPGQYFVTVANPFWGVSANLNYKDVLKPSYDQFNYGVAISNISVLGRG